MYSDSSKISVLFSKCDFVKSMRLGGLVDDNMVRTKSLKSLVDNFKGILC